MTGGTTPSTTVRHTTATATATVPASRTTLRCNPMRPATTAPRPSRAARLNTFDPMTTPAPSRCWPVAVALTAAVTSGASAASAATMPSNASDRPSRSPTRSSRDTSSQLVARLTAAPARNAATAIVTVIKTNPCILAKHAAEQATVMAVPPLAAARRIGYRASGVAPSGQFISERSVHAHRRDTPG